MDRLQATEFVARLSGKIYLSHYQAIAQLSPEILTASENQWQANQGGG
jgi:SulP family sulfate permease